MIVFADPCVPPYPLMDGFWLPLPFSPAGFFRVLLRIPAFRSVWLFAFLFALRVERGASVVAGAVAVAAGIGVVWSALTWLLLSGKTSSITTNIAIATTIVSAPAPRAFSRFLASGVRRVLQCICACPFFVLAALQPRLKLGEHVEAESGQSKVSGR